MNERLPGTKKLFPTDYERFKAAMIKAAEEKELPVMMQMGGLDDFSIRDFQDLFTEFQLETGLEMHGSFFLCEDCKTMHLMLAVDYPEKNSEIPLQ